MKEQLVEVDLWAYKDKEGPDRFGCDDNGWQVWQENAACLWDRWDKGLAASILERALAVLK